MTNDPTIEDIKARYPHREPRKTLRDLKLTLLLAEDRQEAWAERVIARQQADVDAMRVLNERRW